MRWQLDDHAGSSGSVTLNRDGLMDIQARDQAGQRLRIQVQLRGSGPIGSRFIYPLDSAALW